MELLQGEPLKKRFDKIFHEMASKEGKTVEDYKKELTEEYLSGKKEMPRTIGEWEMSFYISLMKCQDYSTNCKFFKTF